MRNPVRILNVSFYYEKRRIPRLEVLSPLVVLREKQIDARTLSREEGGERVRKINKVS